jgi:tripartite-type tricarboxylate transporter receptor subunit TctC
MTRPFHRRAALGLAAASLCRPALAQEWPRQPVKIIVPAAGGGSSDPVARFFAQEFSRRFGQPFVVENRPGAAGNVGIAAAARAPADGHTLLFGFAGPLATNLALYRDLPFHTQRDFDAVALCGALPNVLIVGRGSPAATLAEFVARARAEPGRLSYGSTGSGSSMHLAGAMLAAATGAQLTHVPYSSPGAATTDAIAGRLNAMFLGVPGAAPLVRGGEIRALAVLSGQRSSVLPDVPTAAEQGWPEVVMGTWFAIVAPKGTPRPAVLALNAAVNEVLAGRGRDWLRQQGLELEGGAAGGTTEQAEAFLASEIARHAALVRSAGISVD